MGDTEALKLAAWLAFHKIVRALDMSIGRLGKQAMEAEPKSNATMTRLQLQKNIEYSGHGVAALADSLKETTKLESLDLLESLGLAGDPLVMRYWTVSLMLLIEADGFRTSVLAAPSAKTGCFDPFTCKEAL